MTLVPEHIKNLSSYKPGKRIEDVRKEFNIRKIIKLSSNENPLGPSPKAIKCVEKCLKGTNRYPDSSGYKLRNKLAEKFDLDIENVILGNGSEGIMSAIIRTFLNSDDELIGTEDSFIGFRVLANASGRKVNWVRMKNYKYDLDAILQKINDLTKIIYLANPDNPTGTYFTDKQFEKFMLSIPERVLVILDEAYFEYAENVKDYPNSMSYRFDNVITLRTFSKCYGLAGLRVGYGFAHHKLIENLLKVKLPFEPSIPAQEAALGAIDDNHHLKETLEVTNEGIKYLSNKFNLLGFNYIPSVANFLTLIFKNELQASKLLELMIKKGIILRGLKSFGLANCVRITVGTKNENEYFINKLNSIRNEI